MAYKDTRYVMIVLFMLFLFLIGGITRAFDLSSKRRMVTWYSAIRGCIDAFHTNNVFNKTDNEKGILVFQIDHFGSHRCGITRCFNCDYVSYFGY